MFLESPRTNAKIKEILSEFKIPDETREKMYSVFVFLSTVFGSFLVSMDDITDEEKENFVSALLQMLKLAVFITNIEIDKVGYENVSHHFECFDKGLTSEGMNGEEFFKNASAVHVEGLKLFTDYFRHIMEKKPAGEFGVPLGFIIRAVGTLADKEDEQEQE